MKVPIDEVAVIDLNAPVLSAYEAEYRGVVRCLAECCVAEIQVSGQAVPAPEKATNLAVGAIPQAFSSSGLHLENRGALAYSDHLTLVSAHPVLGIPSQRRT